MQTVTDFNLTDFTFCTSMVLQNYFRFIGGPTIYALFNDIALDEEEFDSLANTYIQLYKVTSGDTMTLQDAKSHLPSLINRFTSVDLDFVDFWNGRGGGAGSIVFTGPYELIGSNGSNQTVQGRLINDNYIDDETISVKKIYGLTDALESIEGYLTYPPGTIVQDADGEDQTLTHVLDGIEIAYDIAQYGWKYLTGATNTVGAITKPFSALVSEVNSATSLLGDTTTGLSATRNLSLANQTHTQLLDDSLTLYKGQTTTRFAGIDSQIASHTASISAANTAIATNTTAIAGTVAATTAAATLAGSAESLGISNGAAIAGIYAALILLGLFGSDGSGNPVPISNPPDLTGINNSILDLQNKTNRSQSFLSAMLSAGYCIVSGNTFTLTNGFLQAVNDISELQTNVTTLKTLTSSLLSNGFITLFGGTYTLTPAFIATLSGGGGGGASSTDLTTALTGLVNAGICLATTSGGVTTYTANPYFVNNNLMDKFDLIATRMNTISSALMDTGIFNSSFSKSQDYDRVSRLPNLVAAAFDGYGSDYGNIGLLPPYQTHLFANWILRNYALIQAKSPIVNNVQINWIYSALTKAYCTSILYTSSYFPRLDTVNGITGSELNLLEGGLHMNKIGWGDHNQASTYTHCMLFRAGFESGSSSSILFSVDGNNGLTGMCLAQNTVGIYAQVGNGSYFYASKPPIVIGTSTNVVPLKLGKYYLICFSYGPNINATTYYTSTATTNKSGSTAGTWTPSSSGSFALNTSYQISLYINRLHCGTSAAYPPSYNSGSTLAIGCQAPNSGNQNNNGAGTSALCLVDYSIYSFAFKQTEVNLYYDFIVKKYPGLDLHLNQPYV